MGKIYKSNQLSKLVNDMNKQVSKALADDVARNCYNIMKKWILEEVYNKYDPKVYVRNYELLNSLTVSPVISKNGIISVSIYIPNEKYKDPRHNMLYDVPSHNLEERDSPTIVQVMQILEEGLNIYRPNAEVMDNTIQELKTTNIILKSLISYLKTKGFKIV